MSEVFVLFREVSDQMGTTKVAGVYTTREKAERAGERVKKHRTYVQAWPVDRDPAAFDQ